MAKTQVEGKVVAVTGAARGIGREIAHALAGAGAKVSLGDLDHEEVLQAAAQLPGALGLGLDVTSTASFREFLEKTELALGPIDVLVNNAGVMWVGPFDEEPEAAIHRQFEVNVHGVMRGVRLAAGPMRRRGSGHILTVASASSKLAPAGEASYAAGKHAVLGYLKAVNNELHGSGVHLSVVMPAVVDTWLAAGTSSGPVALLSPRAVADAVLKTVQKPRFEVTVPSWIGPLYRVVELLPERPRHAVLRTMVPDQIALANPTTRERYESALVRAGNEDKETP